jgi:hypothetical protein
LPVAAAAASAQPLMAAPIRTARLKNGAPEQRRSAGLAAEVLARSNGRSTRSSSTPHLELDEDPGHTGRMATVASIARLKVTLDDVEPPVLGRLDVPLDLRLDRLHPVLQAALGWTNAHLWEFRAGNVGWRIPDAEWGPALAGDARKTNPIEGHRGTRAPRP